MKLRDTRFSYIYALSDETEIRYVGQTVSSPQKRLIAHLADARSRPTTHKDYWIRSALNRGEDIQILVVDCGTWTPTERDGREIYWISEYKRLGHRLTNITEGGFSRTVTDDMKNHLSEKLKELWANPVYRDRMTTLRPRSCVRCGAEYRPRRDRDQTCSVECGQALATLQRTGKSRVAKSVICSHCNKKFERNRAGQVTCDIKCAGAYRASKSAKPYVHGICTVCGTGYERNRSNRNRKTCSQECRYLLVVEKRKTNG